MISGVVISLNEEHTIERAIQSLLRIVDEVILVDAESSDNTVKIAEKAGAKVFVRAWEGYGAAKNFGHKQAKHDWILSLDADEEMDHHLINSIQSTKLKPQVQYEFRIVMDYMGRKLRFTEYAPHLKPRLFHKEFYYWDERVVHEKLIPYDHKNSTLLQGNLWHYSFKSRTHHREKIDRYALLSAKELLRLNKNPGTAKRIFGPAYRFFRSYVLKLGILEGGDGYFISSLAAELIRKRHLYFDQMKKKD